MKKIFSLETLIHLIMVSFAAASLGNVHEFLSSAGHPSEVAWALAVALGLGLVTLAIMLTHVDRDAEPETFKWLVIAASMLGLLSGSLQASTYSIHLHGAWPVLLGFGGPLCGEVLLAIASSAFSKAKRRAEFRGVGDKIEEAVSMYLVEAIDGMDRTLIQRTVEKTINKMAVTAVGSVSSKAMSFFEKQAILQIAENAESQPIQIAETTVQNKEISPILHDPEDKIAKMQAGKTAKIAKRHATILQLINGDGLSIDDLAQHAECSPRTIRTDLEALQAAGHTMSINGVVKLV